MSFRLQTNRLELRSWTEADFEPLARMNADPRVTQHFPHPITRAQSEATFNKLQSTELETGITFWALTHENAFIGFCGLAHVTFEANFTPAVEVGWRLHPDAWGQGFASEAGRACLDYGFRNLGLDRIIAFTAHSNLRSENVMRRLGMQKIGEFDHPKIPEGNPVQNHLLYEIKAQNFDTQNPNTGAAKIG